MPHFYRQTGAPPGALDANSGSGGFLPACVSRMNRMAWLRRRCKAPLPLPDHCATNRMRPSRWFRCSGRFTPVASSQL